jgi:hypothetical protein
MVENGRGFERKNMLEKGLRNTRKRIKMSDVPAEF